MKRTPDLLSSFDASWKAFSAAWKKARSKASEKSIHDLRVSTRRLIAILELARVLSKGNDIPRLQRRVKKVLKRMGPLRDVQVQLEGVSHIPKAEIVGQFKRRLKRREKNAIENVQDKLKRRTRQRLADAFEDVRSEFNRPHDSISGETIRRSVEKSLSSKKNAFLKAQRHFHRAQPPNDEALHEMRIALKKLRYVVEAAQPLLGPSAKARAREMHKFQQLMGDTRDVEILRDALEKWAKKKGKKIAVVPTLERLQEKREGLLKKLIASSDQLEHILEETAPKPVESHFRSLTVTNVVPLDKEDHHLGDVGGVVTDSFEITRNKH
jgi:CHAD domain-containing protein